MNTTQERLREEIRCNCPLCDGKCDILDDYSEDGGTCEKCFRIHTEVDEEEGKIYFLKNFANVKEE